MKIIEEILKVDLDSVFFLTGAYTTGLLYEDNPGDVRCMGRDIPLASVASPLMAAMAAIDGRGEYLECLKGLPFPLARAARETYSLVSTCPTCRYVPTQEWLSYVYAPQNDEETVTTILDLFGLMIVIGADYLQVAEEPEIEVKYREGKPLWEMVTVRNASEELLVKVKEAAYMAAPHKERVMAIAYNPVLQ